jgi:phosphatidylserine/phosphatidylglycerophosphate/cardiolipin synthase-like enzyme
MEKSLEETSDSLPVKLHFLEENDFFSFYIGRNAGGKLKTSIDEAKKSIRIVSPFLDETDIDKLRDKQSGPVEYVSMITTLPDNGLTISRAKALGCLIHRDKQKGRNGFEYMVIRGFNLVVFRGNFLHEKLYIIDDEIVFAGSLNFTETGLSRNHESCLTLKDPVVVKKLITYYESLFHANLRKWNINELGKKIYSYIDKEKAK